MDITLTSPAFKSGDPIPKKYTCDGDNTSPPLQWRQAPDGTKSFVLIMDDPDAPRGTFAHWVVYNLPPEFDSLEEGFLGKKGTSGQVLQGRNNYGDIGYGGPCPPYEPAHRYFFRLFALDRILDFSAGATRAQVFDAMQGHILAQSELMGTYARSI